ncbi:hypothetical protein GOP47_0027261 [Adiantum capillus-veneris]|nr:hypothetical protein GOP47_0027261 [Adiantum capillus-veneris]
MICQAASLIRFRALKHKGGICGHVTMVLRIIAGFQPSRTCQAEYFRQLLKPVTSNHLKKSKGFSPTRRLTGLVYLNLVHILNIHGLINARVPNRTSIYPSRLY